MIVHMGPDLFQIRKEKISTDALPFYHLLYLSLQLLLKNFHLFKIKQLLLTILVGVNILDYFLKKACLPTNSVILGNK